MDSHLRIKYPQEVRRMIAAAWLMLSSLMYLVDSCTCSIPVRVLHKVSSKANTNRRRFLSQSVDTCY